jgi:hypothetical protein
MVAKAVHLQYKGCFRAALFPADEREAIDES